MVRIKRFSIILLTVSIVVQSTAPGVSAIDNVQFPPTVEWKKIDTSKFTLIFPEELSDQAAEIAGKLEAYYPADEYSLETHTMRWPVIINNSLVYPNAYVSSAPRHSQLYTIPDQEGFQGTANWLEVIWSHELRHIVQNDKMVRGFTAFAHWLFGEYGSSAMSHFALPLWVWEGDAVLTETLLTSGGRGRYPGFERPLRRDLLNEREYGYYKASLGYYGSYRDTVPSWYVMGYHLCAYIRAEYGIEAFNRILEISADYSMAPLILNIAVKSVTGKKIKDIYSDCLADLEIQWREQLGNRFITQTELIIEADRKNLTNYYPLGSFDNGDAAALLTSAAETTSLVRISPDGRAKRLRKISPFDKNISFNGETFCWTESKSDIRWGNRSWTEIRIFTPATGEYRKITDKTRYLSPSISPNGKQIAAVEISPELTSFIVILDTEDGSLLARYPEPAGAYPSQTCWSDDGNAVVYLRQLDWGESIRLLDPETGINRALTMPSTDDIASPVVIDGWVYYVSEASGLESIHRIAASGGESEMVVSRSFGALSPAAGTGGKLLYADYGAHGFSLAAVSSSAMDATAAHTQEAKPEAGHVDYFEDLITQEKWAGTNGRGKSVTAVDYDIENYSKALGLVNFHSRSLTTTSSGSGIALSLQADDILGNTSGNLYLGWDPSYSEIAAGLTGAWAGFYPVLLYGAELQYPLSNPSSGHQSALYGGVWLPFDFSEGIWNHSLSFQEILQLQSEYSSPLHLLASVASFNWSLKQKSAKRDLIPPLGISFEASWLYTISPTYYNQYSTETAFYLPGLMRNHGLQLDFYTSVNAESAEAYYRHGNWPRGYEYTDLDGRMAGGVSIDYLLPLAYPDFAIGGLMYISRFYMSCYFDAAVTADSFSEISGMSFDALKSTAGFELYTTFHLFNNYVPLSAGLRFIYNLNSGIMRLEDTTFLLGINF
ncbi:MAG: hypothetical protein PQJ61_10620 [Spirochaetales bacterium]|uniref:Peptidase MA-like domain-containing protein n=1 Tax=Candidatus Thalassospirochaeta sargassi TaxID=3119039 RepID=A0AAJ1IDB2_9SPIO|nr:hypothetical protein [Spirochaetales bacterium]